MLALSALMTRLSFFKASISMRWLCISSSSPRLSILSHLFCTHKKRKTNLDTYVIGDVGRVVAASLWHRLVAGTSCGYLLRRRYLLPRL